jgi:hypothetical protein
MSTAQSFLDALVTLSGNAALAEARNTLLMSISDKDLIDVITHGLNAGIPRARPNIAATALLEEIVTVRAADNAAAHAEDKVRGNGSDDAIGDDAARNGSQSDSPTTEIVEGEGKCKSNSLDETTADTNAEQQPTDSAQPKHAQDLSASAAQSSPAGKKRKIDDRGRTQNVRRVQTPEREFHPDAAYSDSGSDIDEQHFKSEIPSSNSENETTNGSNTDAFATTPKALTSWQTIRDSSLMMDLALITNYEAQDRQHAKFVATCSPIIFPTTEVFFMVPVAKDISKGLMWRAPLSSFPLAFVKKMVEKFNKDFLASDGVRRKYFDSIKSKTKAGVRYNCVRESVVGGHTTVKQPEKSACKGCLLAKTLCARRRRPDSCKVALAIYPLPQAERNYVNWRSFDFWVRK